MKQSWIVGLLACALLAAPARAGEKVVDRALAWLAAHQDKDGKWDCDDFMKHDPESAKTTGTGGGHYDAGVTALAVLSFLGAGHGCGAETKDPFAENVKKGLDYLLSLQDKEGCIATGRHLHFMYEHALATLAVCEAFRLSKEERYKQPGERAVSYLVAARNEGLGWRYYPRAGDNDTSITGWCILALESARDGGLKVPAAAFQGALAWVKRMTDAQTGRTGYQIPGGTVGRTPEQSSYPPELSRATTAQAILIRLAAGQDPKKSEAIQEGASALLHCLPDWDGGAVDMDYWYQGTMVSVRLGGSLWRKWSRVALSLRKHQDRDGSWPPDGAWGREGGRIYSTALQTLTFEILDFHRKYLHYSPFGVPAR